MRELSVLIPARNEFYYDIDLLQHTVHNVLENSTESTEIICVLDGYWPLVPLPSHPRLTVVHHSKSVGQRAATNEAARLSKAKYIMKLDAHCSVSKNFDVVLMKDMQPHWTCVPLQYNLLCFEWKCKKCGWIKDQSPKPAHCEKCKSRFLKQVLIWKPRDGQDGRRNTPTHSWRFDSTLTFQYWGQFASDEAYCKRHNIPFRADQQGDIHDTMSLLGACWMMEREHYWSIEGLDEKMGSWGSMGTEISLKNWTSGGEVKVNKRAWFAHFFRVGGIGFPYPDGGRKERAVARNNDLWLNNKWSKQIYPLSWVIQKFSPVPDWGEDNPVTEAVTKAGEEFYRNRLRNTFSVFDSGRVPLDAKCPVSAVDVAQSKHGGVLYYTCNSHDLTLELAARNNLRRSTNGHELGCVALKRTDFGDWTIVLDREKSGGTMHYQILAGLERSSADYVFLCESDVLYHPSHFDFVPPDDSVIYYNTNVWRVRYSDGHAVRTANLQQVSGICANRKLLLDHYRRRVDLIAANNGVFDVKRMAYEPGTRGKFGHEKIANWESEFPNLDITGHGQTLTTPHFSIDSFRNKKYAEGWMETDQQIEGWPVIYGHVREWLEELANG
jgi:glycosyltransferase involved in cell wall biosynthesis